MKFIILILFSFYTVNSFSQIFKHKEGHFYKQPGEEIEQSMDTEYFNEEFEIIEIKKICRITQWERKYHEGIVWVPVHTDGTWKTVRREGYYWTFNWSDWYFCDDE